MEWNWKEYRKAKHQFRSYYCAGCKQSLPCQLLTGWSSKWKSYCCPCYYQLEQEKAQEYNSYAQVLASKQQEKKARWQQYQLLKNYQGCPQCGSKEVDAYELCQNQQLVCQPCLIRKEGGASSPIGLAGKSKWYKKYWGINLIEWLEKYQSLPVNASCAREWLKDKEHLKDCQCLEQGAKEHYSLISDNLKRYQEQLKKCACEKSEKVRVDSDYYGECEECQTNISVASKKRVIRNRNDPRFWGLEIKEKVLCLGCLEKFREKMPVSKQYTFNKYLKRGY